MPTNSRTLKSRFLRSVALCLVVSMALGETRWLDAQPLVSKPPIEQLVEDPSTIDVPLAHASLEDARRGRNGKLIVHFQDAHANFSGQENLAEAMDALMERYGLSLVLAEGCWGDCSLTPIKSITSAEVWRRVAKRFLITGKIHGEEYLSLVSDRPMTILGLEDEQLYRESVEVYRALAGVRPQALDRIHRLRQAVDRLKKSFYPDALLQYEQSASSAVGPYDALLRLAQESGADWADYPELQRVQALKKSEEAVRFEMANLEHAVLLEELAALGALADGREEGGDTSSLNRASQLTYFQKTLNTARQKGLDIGRFRHLSDYVAYLRAFSEINLEKLMSESDRALEELYLKHLPSPDSRVLRSIDRYLVLLDAAHRVQMTARQYAEFKANEPDLSDDLVEGFLNRKLAEKGYLDSWIASDEVLSGGRRALDAFYDLVARRDEAFLSNVSRALDAQHASAAFLIAGGYHTPNLKRLLSENGYGYLVLTPNVTQQTSHDRYEEQLLSTGGHRSLKKVRLTSGQAEKRSRGVLDPDLSKLVKKDRQTLRGQALMLEARSERPGQPFREGTRLSEIVDAVRPYAAAQPLTMGPRPSSLTVGRSAGARLSQDEGGSEAFPSLIERTFKAFRSWFEGESQQGLWYGSVAKARFLQGDEIDDLIGMHGDGSMVWVNQEPNFGEGAEPEREPRSAADLLRPEGTSERIVAVEVMRPGGPKIQQFITEAKFDTYFGARMASWTRGSSVEYGFSRREVFAGALGLTGLYWAAYRAGRAVGERAQRPSVQPRALRGGQDGRLASRRREFLEDDFSGLDLRQIRPAPLRKWAGYRVQTLRFLRESEPLLDPDLEKDALADRIGSLDYGASLIWLLENPNDRPVQLGGGPAVGRFQMEVDTIVDLIGRALQATEQSQEKIILGQLEEKGYANIFNEIQKVRSTTIKPHHKKGPFNRLKSIFSKNGLPHFLAWRLFILSRMKRWNEERVNQGLQALAAPRNPEEWSEFYRRFYNTSYDASSGGLFEDGRLHWERRIHRGLTTQPKVNWKIAEVDWVHASTIRDWVRQQAERAGDFQRRLDVEEDVVNGALGFWKNLVEAERDWALHAAAAYKGLEGEGLKDPAGTLRRLERVRSNAQSSRQENLVKFERAMDRLRAAANKERSASIRPALETLIRELEQAHGASLERALVLEREHQALKKRLTGARLSIRRAATESPLAQDAPVSRASVVEDDARRGARLAQSPLSASVLEGIRGQVVDRRGAPDRREAVDQILTQIKDYERFNDRMNALAASVRSRSEASPEIKLSRSDREAIVQLSGRLERYHPLLYMQAAVRSGDRFVVFIQQGVKTLNDVLKPIQNDALIQLRQQKLTELLIAANLIDERERLRLLNDYKQDVYAIRLAPGVSEADMLGRLEDVFGRLSEQMNGALQQRPEIQVYQQSTGKRIDFGAYFGVSRPVRVPPGENRAPRDEIERVFLEALQAAKIARFNRESSASAGPLKVGTAYDPARFETLMEEARVLWSALDLSGQVDEGSFTPRTLEDMLRVRGMSDAEFKDRGSKDYRLKRFLNLIDLYDFPKLWNSDDLESPEIDRIPAIRSLLEDAAVDGKAFGRRESDGLLEAVEEAREILRTSFKDRRFSEKSFFHAEAAQRDQGAVISMDAVGFYASTQMGLMRAFRNDTLAPQAPDPGAEGRVRRMVREAVQADDNVKHDMKERATEFLDAAQAAGVEIAVLRENRGLSGERRLGLREGGDEIVFYALRTPSLHDEEAIRENQDKFFRLAEAARRLRLRVSIAAGRPSLPRENVPYALMYSQFIGPYGTQFVDTEDLDKSLKALVKATPGVDSGVYFFDPRRPDETHYFFIETQTQASRPLGETRQIRHHIIIRGGAAEEVRINDEQPEFSEGARLSIRRAATESPLAQDSPVSRARVVEDDARRGARLAFSPSVLEQVDIASDASRTADVRAAAAQALYFMAGSNPQMRAEVRGALEEITRRISRDTTAGELRRYLLQRSLDLQEVSGPAAPEAPAMPAQRPVPRIEDWLPAAVSLVSDLMPHIEPGKPRSWTPRRLAIEALSTFKELYSLTSAGVVQKDPMSYSIDDLMQARRYTGSESGKGFSKTKYISKRDFGYFQSVGRLMLQRGISDKTEQLLLIERALTALKADEGRVPEMDRILRTAGARLAEQKEVTWKDGEQVIRLFRAWMTEMDWPLPRAVYRDGQRVRQIVPMPLNTASLKDLAEDAGAQTPLEYLDRLRAEAQAPQSLNVLSQFKEKFAIMPLWQVWFSNHEQLDRVVRQVASLPEGETAQVQIHGAWNGEEAYALALMLEASAPGKDFRVIATDITRPDPAQVNWIRRDRIPEALKALEPQLFTPESDRVVSLKPDVQARLNRRIEFLQGDLTDPQSHRPQLHAVVVNHVLGQSVASEDGVRSSLQNIANALRPGGFLYVDNSRYLRYPHQRTMVEDILKKDFGYLFERMAEGVYRRTDRTAGQDRLRELFGASHEELRQIGFAEGALRAAADGALEPFWGLDRAFAYQDADLPVLSKQLEWMRSEMRRVILEKRVGPGPKSVGLHVVGLGNPPLELRQTLEALLEIWKEQVQEPRRSEWTFRVTVWEQKPDLIEKARALIGRLRQDGALTGGQMILEDRSGDFYEASRSRPAEPADFVLHRHVSYANARASEGEIVLPNEKSMSAREQQILLNMYLHHKAVAGLSKPGTVYIVEPTKKDGGPAFADPSAYPHLVVPGAQVVAHGEFRGTGIYRVLQPEQMSALTLREFIEAQRSQPTQGARLAFEASYRNNTGLIRHPEQLRVFQEILPGLAARSPEIQVMDLGSSTGLQTSSIAMIASQSLGASFYRDDGHPRVRVEGIESEQALVEEARRRLAAGDYRWGEADRLYETADVLGAEVLPKPFDQAEMDGHLSDAVDALVSSQLPAARTATTFTAASVTDSSVLDKIKQADVIFANFILYLLPKDQKTVLAEAFGSMKPGAYLMINSNPVSLQSELGREALDRFRVVASRGTDAIASDRFDYAVLQKIPFTAQLADSISQPLGARLAVRVNEQKVSSEIEKKIAGKVDDWGTIRISDLLPILGLSINEIDSVTSSRVIGSGGSFTSYYPRDPDFLSQSVNVLHGGVDIQKRAGARLTDSASQPLDARPTSELLALNPGLSPSRKARKDSNLAPPNRYPELAVILREIADRSDPQKPFDVLVIGPGSNRGRSFAMEEIAQGIRRQARYTVLDPDASILEVAAQSIRSVHPNSSVESVHANAEDLGTYGQDLFDVVVATNSLVYPMTQHQGDEAWNRELIQRLLRSLKKEGSLVLSRWEFMLLMPEGQGRIDFSQAWLRGDQEAVGKGILSVERVLRDTLAPDRTLSVKPIWTGDGLIQLSAGARLSESASQPLGARLAQPRAAALLVRAPDQVTVPTEPLGARLRETPLTTTSAPSPVVSVPVAMPTGAAALSSFNVTRYGDFYRARLTAERADAPDAVRQALEDLDSVDLLALAYLKLKKGVLGSAYNFLFENAKRNGRVMFREEGGRVFVGVVSGLSGRAMEEIELTARVAAIRQAASGVSPQVPAVLASAVTSRQLVSQALGENGIMIRDFARMQRSAERVEIILSKQAKISPVADITSHRTFLISRHALTGGSHSSELEVHAALQLAAIKANPSVLGPERVAVIGPRSDIYADFMFDPEEGPDKTDYHYIVSAEEKDPRDALKRDLRDAGITDEAWVDKIAAKFSLTVLPPVFNAEEYSLTNLAAMMTTARITARIDLINWGVVDDRVISFIYDMIPKVRSGEFEAVKALALLKEYEPLFGQYPELSIRIIAIKIDEILTFIQKSITAVGSAA